MRDEHGAMLAVEIGTRQALYETTPELGRRGQWLCLNIQPDVAWPTRAQWLDFAGHRLWIIPITSEEHPGVAINRPPELSQDEAEALLYRLLSVIAWRENTGLCVAYRSGGDLPRMIELSKKRGFAIRNEFDFTEMLCPLEEGPRVALALMREARSLNHHGYAFLSYWRILELAYPKTNDRVAWMEATLPTLAGRGVPEALAGIAAQAIVNVNRHLFDSGRCAIAHATGQPIINPDEPRDGRRLLSELPIVRELAIRAIADRFGIDTPSEEYRKHLYELRGWKTVLGPDLLARINEGNEAEDGEAIDMPSIHVRLRECAPYLHLENMIATVAAMGHGWLNLEYRSADRLMAIRFQLNIADERLIFDLENGLFGHDNGSVAAAEYRRENARFIRDYLLNGELQIWNAENGALLSRLSSFIPLNCYIDLDGCNAGIAAAQVEVERRRQALTEMV